MNERHRALLRAIAEDTFSLICLLAAFAALTLILVATT